MIRVLTNNLHLVGGGVLANHNGEMDAQLQAGAQSFTVPFWADLPDIEADITSDDPTVNSTAQKVTAAKQIVRKSFVHASWSEMSLASELSLHLLAFHKAISTTIRYSITGIQ